jgi:hypothetical protein
MNYKNYLIKLKNDNFVKNIRFEYNYNIYMNKLYNTIFCRNIYNYYTSDIFARKSKIMILASKKLKNLNF